MKKVRDIPPVGIRMPDELKEKLKARAKEQGRSLNSEVVQTLWRSFPDGPPTSEK